jgi:hypothetical protein
MKSLVERLFVDPNPLRTLARKTIQWLRIGSYRQRLQIGAVERPHYGYCILNAALLAKKLRYPAVSVLEFGVAGGNGLLNFEHHARQVSRLLDIHIELYGFDTGEGLPQTGDYRDLPYHWRQGFYRIDVPALERRLTTAKLVLGDVRDTARSFFREYKPAPVGAIAYDLDYYSSTTAALQMLESDEEHYLPRVFCYFDDTIGTETELYNDFTGVRLAINEFNDAHSTIKLALPYHLLARRTVEQWYHQIRLCHFFKHSRYNDFIGEENQQLPCR